MLSSFKCRFCNQSQLGVKKTRRLSFSSFIITKYFSKEITWKQHNIELFYFLIMTYLNII
jgi:hypothetical protein